MFSDRLNYDDYLMMIMMMCWLRYSGGVFSSELCQTLEAIVDSNFIVFVPT